MRENLPPGASDAASPDLPPEEKKAFARARVMTDERAEWELFGSSWPPPQPKTRLERLEVLAHKALDVVFKRLKRWV